MEDDFQHYEGALWIPSYVWPSYVFILYGLSCTPSVFQNFINEILRDLLELRVIAYINDILIYSPDLKGYVEHFKEVLSRLKQHQLYVKGKKYEFHLSGFRFRLSGRWGAWLLLLTDNW